MLVSLGRDWAAATSADQLENPGANVDGGPSVVTYPVAADEVFVSRALVSAGRLP